MDKNFTTAGWVDKKYTNSDILTTQSLKELSTSTTIIASELLRKSDENLFVQWKQTKTGPTLYSVSSIIQKPTTLISGLDTASSKYGTSPNILMYPKGHQTTTLRALKPILAAIKITADTASYTLKAFIDTTVVTPSVPMIPDTSLSISPKRLKVYNEKNVFKPNTTTNVPLSSVLSYIPEKMASIRGFNVTSRNINTSKMAFMNSDNYIITTTRDIRVKNVTERVIADTAISTLKTVSNKFNGKKLFFGKTVSELEIYFLIKLSHLL